MHYNQPLNSTYLLHCKKSNLYVFIFFPNVKHLSVEDEAPKAKGYQSHEASSHDLILF